MEPLKSVREAHRRVISQYLQRIEAAKDEPTPTVFNTILRNIQKKQECVRDADQKIIELLQPSEIEAEMLEADDYHLNLEIKISLLEEYRVSEGFIPERETPQVNIPQQMMIPGIQTSQQTVSSSFSQSHKLPKLSLPIFSGNLLQWQTFWDCYESAVHSNPSLTDVQRFTYLKSQLEGSAASAIAGFALTNANYTRAVSLLQERFGQTHKIVQAYMQALLEQPSPSNTLYSLQRYNDQLESFIRGLESLGQHQETYGSLLIPVIIGKLPAEVRKNLAREHGNDGWLLADLRKAIHKEITIMDAGQPVIPEVNDAVSMTASLLIGSRRKSRTQKRSDAENERIPGKKTCIFCTEQHSSNECKKFITCETRIQIVKTKRLCFNCLGNHLVSNCRSNFRCRHCQRKHHTSICDQKLPQNISPTQERDQPDTAILHTTTQSKSKVLLKTAVAPVSHNQFTADANILFDEGAQRSFITEKLADKLNLPRANRETIYLTSFGDSNQTVRFMDTATVYLRTDFGRKVPIQVLIVPTIAVPLRNIQSAVADIPYIRGLKLAHPITHDDTFEISLLIGADHFWDIVQNRVVRGNGPTAVSSKIGYLLSGPLPVSTTDSNANHIMNVLTAPSDVHDIERFWKLEAMGISPDEDDTSKTDYLQNYQENSITFKDGRYCAMLPWKRDHPPLPTNYRITKRRTENTVQRLRIEPHLLRKYGEIIEKQVRRNFIEKVPDAEIQSHPVHYIPHHAVKKVSTTTPIRIVYDCSCSESRHSHSLNDCLENTPPVLNNLTSILVRFRLHPYAVSTDIEKAFLHVNLDEKDRDFTRFLWLSDPTDPDSQLTTYRLKAVLFGATCSPFILNATILKHLEENKHNWVCQTLKRDLYVDNILTSFKQESTMLTYFRDARDLMPTAGFNRRSWSSNSANLRNLATSEKVIEADDTTKVLGMLWNSDTDELMFPERTVPVTDVITKREILQHTSRIYDPLGLLSPVTIRAKILLQELWQQKYDWDTVLPEDILKKWDVLAKDLNQITNLKVSRHYLSDLSKADDSSNTAADLADDYINSEEMKSLHLFVDASTLSYGSTAYLCTDRQSTLVIAKTRVAPLKKLTLPRLELMAAVVGARLANHLQSTCQIDSEHLCLWSDSQIVLHWLRTSKPLKRFVRNRVEEIKTLVPTQKWKYCPTKDNPADLLTRGISAKQFKQNELWMTGPSWITRKLQWPAWEIDDTCVMTTISDDVLEYSSTQGEQPQQNSEKTNTALFTIIDITRFSQYKKLLRVTAYVLRFIRICREKKAKRYNHLTVAEIQKTRVQDAPPFTVTGVDFSGALHVRDDTRQESKAYICLFTCASTRAVHLELVPNLSDEAFMQAFRRFTSRRSVPKIMISDNATTYVAASTHIQRLSESQTLQDSLSQAGTEWKFIPKRAPWYGGWWERLIGLTKSSLKKVFGRSLISYDALQTVVTEIAATINDRPLTYITSSSTDPEPLTPAHLLYGRRLNTLPYQNTLDDAVINTNLSDTTSISKRARLQQVLIHHFRERWRHEYLTSLREHHQASGDNMQTIAVGDVVQIHDDTPRSRWKLARVEGLILGNDGFTRAAKIRTNNGVTNRPIVKLYPLEMK